MTKRYEYKSTVSLCRFTYPEPELHQMDDGQIVPIISVRAHIATGIDVESPKEPAGVGWELATTAIGPNGIQGYVVHTWRREITDINRSDRSER